MTLKNMIPMLNISNIEQSLAFYSDAFGFEVVSDPAAVQEWRWATIRSGNTELMLAETETPPDLKKDIDPQATISWPMILYVYPDDVVQLHTHLTGLGFQPTDLITTIYGMREFSIQDPDGHMLSFGQDADESGKP